MRVPHEGLDTRPTRALRALFAFSFLSSRVAPSGAVESRTFVRSNARARPDRIAALVVTDVTGDQSLR